MLRIEKPHIFHISSILCASPAHTFPVHISPMLANNSFEAKHVAKETALEGSNLKATGIVRRIDDLGRVVIPKEIRRTLRIREGDPLEIYTEKDGEVIFKKYSPMGDIGEFANQICESIGKNTGFIAAVCDRDAIIAVHGVPKRELVDKRCSQELEQLLELRRSYRHQDGDLPVRPTETGERYRVGAAAPIVTQGDLMGGVLLLLEDGAPALSEAEQRLVQTVAGFLGRQMES